MPLRGLKSARKRTMFYAFSGKRDELAKRVHQYSFRALSRTFLGQARFVVASVELSELRSLSSQYLMASRKRKSIGTRPIAQYDTKRHILSKRKVEIYHTELDEFKAELERHNFHKRLTNLVDSNIDLALVKEFYANLYSFEGPSQKQVRGVWIDKDLASQRSLLRKFLKEATRKLLEEAS
ncbi:hypothetical protein GmHk_18G052034 [Glycine max]|nr:hypothetical protein GmHk_18G052034 [Glycine max]